MTDSKRPYPEGHIAWDEAWRQRQRADAAELALRLIRTWAFFIGARNHNQEELRTLILDKSKEVLEAFNDRTT